MGLVKRNDFNFLAGAQKRETRSSLACDNGGHSGGSLPSPMDPKTANGSDAQVTPQLMGMSPDADDLADSAWLNESANLDGIDIEELANGTTVLELVDLPGDENAAQAHDVAAGADAQDTPSHPDTSKTGPPVDAPLPPQETGASVQLEESPSKPAPLEPELTQSETKTTPEGTNLNLKQLRMSFKLR